MLLHVLGHVESHHGPFVVEHELRKRSGQLGLADSGRAEEDERADRPVRILEAGACATQCVRHGGDGGILPDHATVETFLHVNQLLDLALEQPCHRNTGPAADHLGDVVLVDLLLHHRLAVPLDALEELVLEPRQVSVADLGDTLKVARALGPVGLDLQLVNAPRRFLDPVEGLLLVGPASGQLVATLSRLGKLTLDRLANRSRLLRHRRLLDLELTHPAVCLVELDRRGVDLHAQPGRRLVDEVDRLVRQEAVGDVPVGEDGRGRQCGVADTHAVVRLVPLLEAAQDRDRVRHRGLADQDRLEAPLERRILLDVLPVLVECRRADSSQLAPGEHRLQHVGGVDGSLGGAGSDDRMQLVDEEDDLSPPRPESPAAPPSAAPRTRRGISIRPAGSRCRVPNPLALQSLRNVASDDSRGQSLDDGRLPDTRLADQDGVVLRST